MESKEFYEEQDILDEPDFRNKIDMHLINLKCVACDYSEVVSAFETLGEAVKDLITKREQAEEYFRELLERKGR